MSRGSTAVAVHRPRGVGAAVGGGPGADASLVHGDLPAGMVLEPVVGRAQGLEVGDGGRAVGMWDHVVELAASGGGVATGEPAGPVAGPDGSRSPCAGTVGVGVLPPDRAGDGVAAGQADGD